MLIHGYISHNLELYLSSHLPTDKISILTAIIAMYLRSVYSTKYVYSMTACYQLNIIAHHILFLIIFSVLFL